MNTFALFFVLPLIFFKSVWKGYIKRDLREGKRWQRLVENSVSAQRGGKNGQSKKNCSKLTDDISVHCSPLDAAAVLASAGLVLPGVCFLKLHVILRGGEEQEDKCLRISDSC